MVTHKGPYDLKKPCPDCPFRRDPFFFLRQERVQEIADGEGEFSCHKTLGNDEEGETYADAGRRVLNNDVRDRAQDLLDMEDPTWDMMTKAEELLRAALDAPEPKYVLVYHCAIASVFRVKCFNLQEHGRDAKPLFTGPYAKAIAFAKGIGATGATVRTASCEHTGVVTNKKWSDIFKHDYWKGREEVKEN